MPPPQHPEGMIPRATPSDSTYSVTGTGFDSNFSVSVSTSQPVRLCWARMRRVGPVKS